MLKFLVLMQTLRSVPCSSGCMPCVCCNIGWEVKVVIHERPDCCADKLSHTTEFDWLLDQRLTAVKIGFLLKATRLIWRMLPAGVPFFKKARWTPFLRSMCGEHLSEHDGKIAARNCFQFLQPRWVLTCCCPRWFSSFAAASGIGTFGGERDWYGRVWHFVQLSLLCQRVLGGWVSSSTDRVFLIKRASFIPITGMFQRVW